MKIKNGEYYYEKYFYRTLYEYERSILDDVINVLYTNLTIYTLIKYISRDMKSNIQMTSHSFDMNIIMNFLINII